ncbi:hexose transporter-like protein [Gymnopus androsaceus JB14]|uniref:Hexose transporter-like protein n=1 Tax=Gymnopus androsaceus JB14 TaxID=1447944 RepID=A0A6A4I1X6_9AGAR|nr:hexose transporter-like protein [Gymnopus androsaceus JB14]
MEDKTTHWKNNTHPNWWMDPGLRKNTGWIVLLYFGSFAVGYDSSLMSGFQAMPQWNKSFNNPSGVRLGLISASLSFATIPMFPLISWVCDTYGRRWAIILGSIGTVCSFLLSSIIVGAIITCLSKNEGMFIAGRVVTGVFYCFPYAACSCLINELAHPRLRGISAAFLTIAYQFGSAVGAWSTFACLFWESSDWSWRLPALLQACGPLVVVVTALLGPESPRFLLSKFKGQQALDILAKFHANGDYDDELVQREFQQISEHIQKERANKSGSWSSLIATPANRRRLLIVCVVASGLVVTTGPISAYLPIILRSVGIKNPIHISAVNGALAIFNVFTTMMGGLCVDKVGRRPLFLISTTGILITYTVITILAAEFARTQAPPLGIAFVIMLFLCYGMRNIAWAGVSELYPVEILPFSIRSKAVSFGMMVTTASTTISAFLNPIGLRSLQWRFYFVFLAIQTIYLLLIWWFFIETKGRTIEQVSVIFDELGGDAPPGLDTESEEKDPYLS